MSKFNFLYMCNSDTECVCFNKKNWTKELALIQAGLELDMTEGLVIFSSHVQYGYFATEDNGVMNGWFIKDMYEPIMSKPKNAVPVWVIRKVDDLK